jgi:hypothetical protein
MFKYTGNANFKRKVVTKVSIYDNLAGYAMLNVTP